jgi:hypothetical protein
MSKGFNFGRGRCPYKAGPAPPDIDETLARLYTDDAD